MKAGRGLTLALIIALAFTAGCAGSIDTGGGPVRYEQLPGFPMDRVQVEAVDQRADRSPDPALAAKLKNRVERALAPAVGGPSQARHLLRVVIVEHSADREQFPGKRMTYPRWTARTVLRAQLRGPDGTVLRNWKANGWAGDVQVDRISRQEVASRAFDQALARLFKAMAKYSIK